MLPRGKLRGGRPTTRKRKRIKKTKNCRKGVFEQVRTKGFGGEGTYERLPQQGP